MPKMSPAHPASIDLSALAGALAELGPERASTADLAHAAGVAKPTLFARFGSREGVLLACVEHEAERLLDRVYASGDPGGGLAAYARESPGWPLLLLARHPAAVAARTRIAARIAAEGGGGAELRPQVAAAAFLAAAATVLESEPASAAPRTLRSLADALVRGHTDA
jgi:AcrR family transcriptional regulator